MRGGFRGCGPDFLFVAVQAVSQTIAVRAEPGYGQICGPNYIIVGRMPAQLVQPAQFLSKIARCLCLLVGGFPNSPLHV